MEVTDLRKVLHHYDILEKATLDNENILTNKLFTYDTVRLRNENIALFQKTSTDNIEISKQPRFIHIPKHIHNYVELSYVYEGESHQFCDGEKIDLCEGEMVLLDQSTIHELLPHDEKSIVVNVILPIPFISKLNFTFMEDGIIKKFMRQITQEDMNHSSYVKVINPLQKSIYKNLIELILCEYYQPKRNSFTLIYQMIQLFFELLSREKSLNAPYLEKNVSNDISEAYQYIVDNFYNCSLKEVSERFYYSPNYLSRLLKKQYGKTFSQIVLENQMEYAKNLLDETNLSIVSIKEMVGIHNNYQFYKQFERYFGMKLKDYQRANH